MARPSVKNERRAQILDGLYEAMSRQGTRGTSITEIAKSAGIARGALHYYFDSKEEIRIRLMERLGARYIDGLSAFLDSREDKLAALATFHFGGDADDSERLLTVWIDYWGQAPSDVEVNAVVFHVQARARELCASALVHHLAGLTSDRNGVDEQSDDDDDRTALGEDAIRIRGAAMLALIEGALLQWRVAAQTDAPLQRKALRTEITNGLTAMATAPHVDTTRATSTTSTASAERSTSESEPESDSEKRDDVISSAA